MSSPDKIRVAKTESEILSCWPVIKELRPHLIESELVHKVQEQQKEAGFVLTYIEENGKVVGILSYRILKKLFDGVTLYIDDVCTLSSAQGKGHAGQLMDSAIKVAKELKCDSVTLDSGYTRNAAHKFYLIKGFKLASHHFTLHLK